MAVFLHKKHYIIYCMYADFLYVCKCTVMYTKTNFTFSRQMLQTDLPLLEAVNQDYFEWPSRPPPHENYESYPKNERKKTVQNLESFPNSIAGPRYITLDHKNIFPKEREAI